MTKPWTFDDSIRAIEDIKEADRIDEERREAQKRRIPESLHAVFQNEPIVHHALTLYLNGTIELEDAMAMAITCLSEVLRQTRELVLRMPTQMMDDPWEKL